MNHVKIRKRRRELDITQDEAARLAGMGTKQSWSQIESGKRDDIKVSTLLAMAKVLQLPPADLLIVE